MNNWQEVSLSDLAEYINGRAIKPEECSTDQGIPVIRIKQINDPDSVEDLFHGDNLEDKNIARKGDLLFSWSATLKTILWQGPVGAINQHIFKVVPKDGIDKTFLHYLIELSIPALSEESHGSTMKHIKKSALSSFRLQVPPLPEQKKIAEMLSAIDAEISALETKADKIKNYTLAISRRIFAGLVANESIQKCPAEDLCSLVTKGTTPSKSATTESKSVPFLRVTNLGFNGAIEPTQDFELITQTSHKGELKRSICRPGDILMNIVGPPLGKVGIIPQEISECNINQAVLVYRIAADRLDPSFFVHFLLGQVAQHWFHSQSKKTSGQQNLTIETCKSIAVPLPSMSEQKKFSGCLDSLSALESHIVKKKSSLEFLKYAVASELLSGRKRVGV